MLLLLVFYWWRNKATEKLDQGHTISKGIKLDSDSRSLKNYNARPCASLPVRNQQTVLEFLELEEITKFCIFYFFLFLHFLEQRKFFQIKHCMWFQYWKKFSWSRSWGPFPHSHWGHCSAFALCKSSEKLLSHSNFFYLEVRIPDPELLKDLP